MFAADEIETWLAPAFQKRSTDEWFHAGQAARVPLAIVPTTAQLLDSEQLRALDAFREIEDTALGAQRVPAAPFRLHGTPAHSDGPVAALGQHRDAGPVQREAAPTPSRTAARRSTVRDPGRRPDLLRGVRIIDLSMGWAGPLATRYLADLGAEVIKVESTRHFDWWRGWDATPEAIADRVIEKAPGFNAENRNKLGVTLDLTDPRGLDLLKRLLGVSDAVIENYSADVMAKLGLDDEVLRACNPDLVRVSMPPFGAGGPWHSYRAYGSTVEQASGLPHLNGHPEDPPTMTHVALGDPVAGVYAAGALLLGLLHQQRTGEGQRIDLSQVEALATLGLHGLAEQIAGKTPARRGNRHAQCAPQGVYPCAGDDAWVTLTVESDAQYTELRKLMDLPPAATAAERHAAHDEIDERIREWTGSRERDAVVALLIERGIPAGPVLDAAELLEHPQLAARGFWQFLDREVVGRQPHPSAPYRFGADPFAIDTPAPTLGEHGREVLSSLLGLDSDALTALEADGIIGREPRV
jgi:crotonobetainyl-CoA:carnitine CoA-transferase CaiB-like acyl-CoA transferase